MRCPHSRVLVIQLELVNATEPCRQEGIGRGSQRGSGESPVRGGGRIPWPDGYPDDGSALEGAGLWRVHACRKEHAGTQGSRGHGVRIHGNHAERTAGAGLFEGRSGRCCARDQGLREDQRQARDDESFDRGRRALAEGSRQGCEPADEGSGAVDAAGRDESPAAEARRHPSSSTGQARPHCRRDSRPEAGAG